MKHRIIPAIMSGGAGTRLWPLSTEAAPKQFHAIGTEAPLFVETLRRVSGEAGALSFAPPLVLANARHAELVRTHLGAVTPIAIVLEPMARNTAAVAAIAAALAAAAEPDALLLLLPADHLVADVPAFHATLECAAPFARERIVTFGITPDRPATGYGYIKIGAQLGEGVHTVERFREKPNEATAREYLAQGGYAWNGGIFLAHPRILLDEFAASADIRDAALAALAKAAPNGAELRIGAAEFAAVPSQPFDIAVMEKTARAAVAPCSFGWADIGSWDEIWRLSKRDSDGNVAVGSAAALDGANNLLRGEGVKLAVAGVNNLIVVATREGVIVLPRDRAQDVKLLKELAEKLGQTP